MAFGISKTAIKNGVTDRLQPWQALFGLLMYVVTQFDMSADESLILAGLLAATLGFTQLVNYKHKEAIKEVVAPWLLQRLMEELKMYLPELPVTPIEEPVIPVDEPTREELLAKLKELEHG